jgi:cytochrome c1
VAAINKKLPEDFDQWHLVDHRGLTVAHIVATYRCLPRFFKQWDMVDADGWSVAHVAALHGTLPDDFEQWSLTTFTGLTVEDVAAQRKMHLRSDKTITNFVQHQIFSKKQSLRNSVLQLLERAKKLVAG